MKISQQNLFALSHKIMFGWITTERVDGVQPSYFACDCIHEERPRSRQSCGCEGWWAREEAPQIRTVLLMKRYEAFNYLHANKTPHHLMPRINSLLLYINKISNQNNKIKLVCDDLKELEVGFAMYLSHVL